MHSASPEPTPFPLISPLISSFHPAHLVCHPCSYDIRISGYQDIRISERPYRLNACHQGIFTSFHRNRISLSSRQTAGLHICSYRKEKSSGATDIGLSVCCCFTSYQHLRSYRCRYRFVTVHTHSDFRVLFQSETRLLAP